MGVFFSRVSDPSELPCQSNIADLDLNVIEENKSATVSTVPTTEPLTVLSVKGRNILIPHVIVSIYHVYSLEHCFVIHVSANKMFMVLVTCASFIYHHRSGIT